MLTLPMRQQVPDRVLARVGTFVQQKYRIDRILGVGGMAAVYAATHRNGHRVAIKFLLDRFGDEPHLRRLFTREAHLANEVGHPGAVPVIDDDVDEHGCAFLVMPLLEGETLRMRWERANRRLPVSEAGVLMSDVLDVLASAHAKGIVHRDIKPDNLFITIKGDVRVLDFGIGRHTETDASATLTGPMVGTPAFMPPEQALGNREAIGPHSDCWSVGATLFALLSGEFVHLSDNAGAQFVAAAVRPARSLREAAPELHSSIIQFVDKALSFDRTARWPSAGAMRDGLIDAFETALGAPLATVAAPVRADLVRELSHPRDDIPSKEAPE
ncbi:MAG TPA: serine/threonine-protein kinase, partial [Polyangiaceae bacterium]|nr:serine/threonine-protein kinase [Polyangiaceae bacterium]